MCNFRVVVDFITGQKEEEFLVQIQANFKDSMTSYFAEILGFWLFFSQWEKL